MKNVVTLRLDETEKAIIQNCANFKDFDACFTDGESIEEVIINAKDVLEGTIFSLLKSNLKVPEPILTRPSLESNEFLVYIDI